MLHVASVCTRCCMLLDVVACYCAKFETGQTFQPTTPNISFVPWSPKRSATMLDPFAQLFQHCWGHASPLRMLYPKTYGLYPSYDAQQAWIFFQLVLTKCFKSELFLCFCRKFITFSTITNDLLRLFSRFCPFLLYLGQILRQSHPRLLRAGDTESLDSFFASADRPYAS